MITTYMIHVLLVNTSSLTCLSYTRKVHLSTQSLTAVFLAACIVASQKLVQKVLQDPYDRYINLFYMYIVNTKSYSQGFIRGQSLGKVALAHLVYPSVLLFLFYYVFFLKTFFVFISPSFIETYTLIIT